ncbi:MAG: hypothetical protein KC457_25400 [Myxococcales bacterium]|nr:hypothetical protein [Myxococcales bacterium]
MTNRGSRIALASALALTACPEVEPSLGDTTTDTETGEGDTTTDTSTTTDSGDEATASTTSTTDTTDTDSESDTQSETESDTGEACAQDCAALDDPFGCGVGECVAGECVFVAAADHSSCGNGFNDCLVECMGGVCGPEPGTDPCGGLSKGCSVGYCDQGSCAIDFCERFDGESELKLRLVSRSFLIPLGLEIGANVEVTSFHGNCDDCESDSFDVVRSLDDGTLILSKIEGEAHHYVDIEALFETSFLALFDPFVEIDDLDQGLCEPVDNQGCFETPISTMFEHSGGSTGWLLDRTVGSIEDYRISTFGAVDQMGVCNDVPPIRSAFIERIDCGGPCAEPTVIDSCVPPSDPLGDTAYVSGDVEGFYPYSTWKFECQVLDIVELSATPEQIDYYVPLDCIPLVIE